MYYDKDVPLSTLIGKKITKVTGLIKDSDEVDIFTDDGNQYRFHHEQDCCECVTLEDFEGVAENLTGATILSAEESSRHEDGEDWESNTWTFYRIDTTQGEIWLRWLGSSNGYYSEAVDFIWVNKPESED